MMSINKGKGPIVDPGLCRCCGSMKKCRVLNAEYQYSGQKEVYSDMIMDCFGLLLSHLDGKTSERLVCATCVIRLREAFSFRRQVLRCEEAFLQMKVYDSDNTECVTRMEAALVAGTPRLGKHVKTEPSDREHGASDSDECEDALAGTPEHVTRVEKAPMEVQLVKTEPFDCEHGASDTDACDALADTQEDTVKAELLNEDSNSTDDVPLQRVATRLSQSRPASARVAWTNGSRPLVRTPSRPKLPISKMQQIIRERDATYMIDTNIITIVENSYVCPFKCRHNHLLCYYCGENFADPMLLREHTANAHHPKRFKVSDHKNMTKIDLTRIDCRLCPIKIDDLEEFKRHVVQVHKKKFYFDYKDSVLPFILNKDEIKCAICHVIFPYFHALNKHMNEHFSNYVCETCGLGFVDRSRFVMHQARHEEGDFPCETCGKVFKAEYNRDLHIDRVHKKRGRVYCPKCDVKLMSYPQKLKHLVEVHGEQPLSFPCSVCDRVFDTRRTLTIHWRKDHLKDFRYECQICGQKFFTRFALNNHMPTHTGERNFKCKVCEKCYPRLKTLKDHMRIHTNDRRYRCHICGQAFIQNCSLKGHMKSQHPEYG